MINRTLVRKLLMLVDVLYDERVVEALKHAGFHVIAAIFRSFFTALNGEDSKTKHKIKQTGP